MSWYGSWPRVPKSSASTQIAGESIHGRTLRPRKTADFSKYETRKASDAASVYTTASTTTLANIGENGPNASGGNGGSQVESAVAAGQTDGQEDTPKSVEDTQAGDVDKAKDPATTEQPGTAEPVATNGQVVQATETEVPSIGEEAQQPSTAYGWLAPLGAPLGWWTKPIAGATSDTVSTETAVQESTEHSKDMELDATTEAPAEAPTEAPTKAHAVLEPSKPVAEGERQPQQSAAPRTSWFGIWSSSTVYATKEPQPAEALVKEADEPVKPVDAAKEQDDVVMQNVPPAEESAQEPTNTAPPKAGSTWAFWSRDTGSKTKGKATSQKQDSDEEEGQLAVMGESSENQPQLQKTKSIEVEGTHPPKEPPVQSPETEDSPPKSSWLGTSPAKGSMKAKKSQRLRPRSMDLDQVSIESREEPPAKPETSKVEPPVKPGSSKTATTIPAAKPAQPNLLLPSFKSTYRLKENPSIIKQITQLLLRTQHSQANHVYLNKELPKIRKALAIGVHGLFPATYLRPMIGQPTGTSIKFANHAADSIRRWADAHNNPECEIEKVALEGEGKIGERVENLWKLLLNWIDTIRAADLIILACHSQGVPVTIMLLAKLFELGVISPTTRVGVCAMAGVSLGPFPDYRSGMGILMGSAAELWEFSNPSSDISRRLEAAMKVVLDAGARITFVGSMDDQLVPMESAIYSPAHHPYIYRSVFIDGRLHTPDFIAHLVGFALKLRNLGVTDHGLVRELSLPLAGSLYSGEGHSRLYDEAGVYEYVFLLSPSNHPSVGAWGCD